MSTPRISDRKESANATKTKIVEREHKMIKQYIALGYVRQVARHIPLYIISSFHQRDENGKKEAETWFHIQDFECRNIRALEGLHVKQIKPEKEYIWILLSGDDSDRS